MASIQDVAKAANVSKSTVSRVINDHPSISKETKNRVMREVKRLNYVPNSLAKSLSDGKSYTITLLVDADDEKSFQNPYFYEVMHGIESVVYKNGYTLVVANIMSIVEENNIIDWFVKGKRTEGIILPSTIVTDELVKDLKANRIPHIVVGVPDTIKESVSWVDVNNKFGGEQAVYELVKKGYGKPAIIGYDKTKVFSKQRIEGYRHAMNVCDIPINEEHIRTGEASKHDGYRIVRELLALEDRPDSIICSNELMSIGAIRAISEMGFSIPNEIGMISFDSERIAELSYPEITTINADIFKLGLKACELLFEAIDETEQTITNVMIPTTIVERETVK